MEKEFVYVLKFRDNYLFHVTDIETAIKLAKQLKKSLISLGRIGSYDIYYDGVLIAQF
jgi:hypothetical protein